MPARWRTDLDAELARAAAGTFTYRRSAAALFGLDGHGPPAAPELAVVYPRSAGRGIARLRNLTPADLVRIDGVPATCIGRTLVDLGTVDDVDLLERAVESALRHGLVSEPTLRRLASARDLHGLPRLREVLARRPLGAPATGSDAETLMVQLVRRGGLPDPERQLPQMLGAEYRLDLSWTPWRVTVEVDGRGAHGPEQFVNDRRRQNRIVLAHWLLLRFTYTDIVDSPELTLGTLVAALRQRGWPG